MVPTQRALHLVLLCVFAFVLAGFSKEGLVTKSPVSERRANMNVAQLGAEVQKGGIMSQKDYIRIVSLQRQISQTHTLSEEYFAWTLSLLATANNSLTRARAMTVLADIDPMSSSQKATVTSAIAPHMNDGVPLDAAGTRNVQKSIQMNQSQARADMLNDILFAIPGS